MLANDLDQNAADCMFPNVRKTYWRSATWNSPSSPKLHPVSFDGGGGSSSSSLTSSSSSCTEEAGTSSSRNNGSCSQQEQRSQSFRCRTPLPALQPLSIARKSFDEWPSAGLDDLVDSSAPSTPGVRRSKAGLDIKLDLSFLPQASADPTEIQTTSNKFAQFDKECSQVANYHIYLGSDAVAKDREVLRAHGITHVLNCVGFVCPEYFKSELVYKTLWLQDNPCEDITSLLYDVFDYFEEVREQGGRVFVHCCKGVSRSTSLVIAYLMWREKRCFEDAFQDVKKARGITNPNMGFAFQLLQCEKRVHAKPMSPRSMLRMYRLAPHSPYDPLHLVPKAESNPGAGCLDSRGAFVIHMPSGVIVWIGQCCHHQIAQAAKEAANQVVRYERAQGPVKILLEDHEGPDFWESLRSYSNYHSPRTSEGYAQPNALEFNGQFEEQIRVTQSEVEKVRHVGAVNRKVLSNDADYELYHTAMSGGVIPPVSFAKSGMTVKPIKLPAREDGWSVLRRKFLVGELSSVKGRTESLEQSHKSTCAGKSTHVNTLHPLPLKTVTSQEGNNSHSFSHLKILTSANNNKPLSHLKTFISHNVNNSQANAPVDQSCLTLGKVNRKPKLPPLVSVEQHGGDNALEDVRETNFKFETLGEVCKDLLNDVSSHCITTAGTEAEARNRMEHVNDLPLRVGRESKVPDEFWEAVNKS